LHIVTSDSESDRKNKKEEKGKQRQKKDQSTKRIEETHLDEAKKREKPMRLKKTMKWRRGRRRKRGYKETNEKFKRLEIMERRERSNCMVGSNKWMWESKRTMEHSRYTNCPSQTTQDPYIN
jgi:hypothetical protein